MAKADSLGTETRELVDLVVGYAKQETVEPIKGLGKSVGFGLAGAFLVAIGTVFLGLAALRALQTETDLFDDELSWGPYLILSLLLLAAAGISWKALGPGAKENDQ